MLHWLSGVPQTEEEQAKSAGPPYADLDKLTEEQRDYIWNWVDHFWTHHCENDVNNVVGYIAEWDQKGDQ